MRKEVTIKKPGGKTLKIEIEIENNKIKDISFSGDFFAYPPEALEELEKELVSTTIDAAEKKILSYKDRVILLGVSIDDIIKSLRNLLE